MEDAQAIADELQFVVGALVRQMRVFRPPILTCGESR
jgi:hypothetical protein